MYHNILVPLDGSELAECALPQVEAVVRGSDAKNVTFLRVVPPAKGTPTGWEHMFGEEELKQMESRNKSLAEDYLKQLTGRVKYDGALVKWEIIIGERAILRMQDGILGGN